MKQPFVKDVREKYNSGIEFYNKKDYDNALKEFQNQLKLIMPFGRVIKELEAVILQKAR